MFINKNTKNLFVEFFSDYESLNTSCFTLFLLYTIGGNKEVYNVQYIVYLKK